MTPRRAIIIGAGPAGLTAAYELIDRSAIAPVVFEASSDVGGISKTVDYRGNRIDIGGHRFFSRSDRVVRWWQNLLPLQGAPARDDRLLGRDVPLASTCRQRPIGEVHPIERPAPDPERTDRVLLHRRRVSRIFFLGKLFAYPISLRLDTLANLGFGRALELVTSYLRARLRPVRAERSLEDYIVNRFGRALYRTFFEDYTEKVWGVPCREIAPAWGAQRIKGLSLTKAVRHALEQAVRRNRWAGQDDTETSLIEHFLYPKYGPGQMWETAARAVTDHGGEIHLRHRVVGVVTERSGTERSGTERSAEQGSARQQGERVTAVRVRDEDTGQVSEHRGDVFLSTMPVKDLIAGFDTCPDEVRAVAAGLLYRDFITVGVLVRRLALKNTSGVKTVNDIVPDNWIYVQEPGVKVARLQIYNNWSPYLVADRDTMWLGLEYFCNEGDPLWQRSDEQLAQLAVDEATRIGILRAEDVLDTTTIRMPKAYPAYFGTYDRFSVVRDFVDRFDNLFLIGRNGMHRYNNQDHSMLSAMVAVDHLLAGIRDRDGIWRVNAEQRHHEEEA